MANYQGLNPIMGEITTMLSNSKSKEHTEHIYQFTEMMEKFVRIASRQLFTDYMEDFKENLIIEFETYLNGSHINHTDITQAIADIIQKAISNTKITVSL